MDELGKVKRVIEKQSPIDEVLLVLDATTGQNGLRQAEVFSEAVKVTGIVLTKLDGTAKGGIVVAVQRQLGVPVKLVGLGEGPDDLAPFDAEAFVDAIVWPERRLSAAARRNSARDDVSRPLSDIVRRQVITCGVVGGLTLSAARPGSGGATPGGGPRVGVAGRSAPTARCSRPARRPAA